MTDLHIYIQECINSQSWLQFNLITIRTQYKTHAIIINPQWLNPTWQNNMWYYELYLCTYPHTHTHMVVSPLPHYFMYLKASEKQLFSFHTHLLPVDFRPWPPAHCPSLSTACRCLSYKNSLLLHYWHWELFQVYATAHRNTQNLGSQWINQATESKHSPSWVFPGLLLEGIVHHSSSVVTLPIFPPYLD